MYQPIEPIRPSTIGPTVPRGADYFGGFKIARLGARLGGGLIDFLLVGISEQIVSAVLPGWPGWLIWFGLWFAVMAAIPDVYNGYSPGKFLLGLQIVEFCRDEHGFFIRRPGLPRLTARYFAHFLDIIPFMIGYLRINGNPMHQTFADEMCHTIVVYRRGPLYGAVRLEH